MIAPHLVRHPGTSAIGIGIHRPRAPAAAVRSVEFQERFPAGPGLQTRQGSPGAWAAWIAWVCVRPSSTRARDTGSVVPRRSRPPSSSRDHHRPLDVIRLSDELAGVGSFEVEAIVSSPRSAAVSGRSSRGARLLPRVPRALCFKSSAM